MTAPSEESKAHAYEVWRIRDRAIRAHYGPNNPEVPDVMV